MQSVPDQPPKPEQRQYWRTASRHARFTAVLFVLLVAATPFVAASFDGGRLFGFRLGFFLLGPGTVVGLVLLCLWSTRRQNRLDDAVRSPEE